MTQPSFLTIADVALLAGISHSTLRGYLAREQMPPADGRLGRTPWWNPDTIQPWLDARERSARVTSQASVTFPVSGQAMSTIQGSELWGRPHLYDSEQATLVASDALHSARLVRRGKGTSHLVTTTPAAAEVIRDYCATVGEGFAMEDEPDIRAEGRALLKVARAIAGAMPWQG